MNELTRRHTGDIYSCQACWDKQTADHKRLLLATLKDEILRKIGKLVDEFNLQKHHAEKTITAFHNRFLSAPGLALAGSTNVWGAAATKNEANLAVGHLCRVYEGGLANGQELLTYYDDLYSRFRHSVPETNSTPGYLYAVAQKEAAIAAHDALGDLVKSLKVYLDVVTPG